jgi:energy-coupling factor transport system permease protein
VASALERATTLAESMDSRGYGRSAGRFGPSTEPYLVSVSVAASLAAASLAALWALGVSRPMTGALTIALLLIIFGSLTKMSRNVPRVRYRRNRWKRVDWLVATASALIGAAAIGLSILGTRQPAFNPYEKLLPPPPEVTSVLLAIALLIPAVIVETSRKRPG